MIDPDNIENPYGDGVEAAYRIGRYGGWKDTPKNPFPKGTGKNASWAEGFADGTEDLIESRNS